ncbi:hypothetical protein BH23VER1_BH23VER1_32970 [soil metagenome]
MWYYVTLAGEKAEAPNNDLTAAIQSGLVARDTLVWEEGMANWQAAGQVRPELFGSPPLAAPAPSLSQPSPLSDVPYPPPPPGRTTPGLTVASFVCGLVSIVLGLGALTGIPAVILGHMAMKLYRTEPEIHEGRGLAVAGLVLGYISIALTVLGILLFLLLIGGGLFFSV